MKASQLESQIAANGEDRGIRAWKSENRALRLVASGVFLGLVLTFASPYVTAWTDSLRLFQGPNHGVHGFEVALGTKVVIPNLDGTGVPIRINAPCFLISLSDCGTCGIAPLDPNVVPHRVNDLPVIIVYADEVSRPRSKLIAPAHVDSYPSFLPPGMRISRPQCVQLDNVSRVVRVAVGGEAIQRMLGIGGRK